MIFYIFYLFFLFFPKSVVSNKNASFDCTNFPSASAGDSIFIPYKSINPVEIPFNFSCTYQINVQTLLWVQINIFHNLLGPSIFILIDDGLSHKTRLDSSTNKNETFYFIQNTSGKISIFSENSTTNSSVLIKLQFFKMPTAKTMKMTNIGRVNYFDLNQVLHSPISVIGNEKIVATIAKSGFSTDEFRSFFVFDGDLKNYQNIYRLDDFKNDSNIISSENILTIIGFSNFISPSSIIFQNFHDVSMFDQISGITVADQTKKINIKSDDRRTLVTFVTKNNSIIVLKSLIFTEIENNKCNVTAISGSPTNYSKPLIDLSPIFEYSLPQLFPASFFSILVENCQIQLEMSNEIESDYYAVKEKKSGFIFSPSYLDPDASSVFNITYSSGNNSLTFFSFQIEDLKILKNGELDVNILTFDLIKTMSLIITGGGNEKGAKSRASGNYFNVQMLPKSIGKVKIRFQADPNGNETKSFLLSFFFIFLKLLLIIY